MINEAKKYFDENGYVVIQNFIKPEMFCLLYEYMKMKARRELLNEAYYPESYISHINGKFDDTQAIGAYSLYGDPLTDSLLQNSTNFISNTNASYGAKEYSIKILASIMQPITPHLSQEIWSLFGCKSFLYNEKWPIICIL